MRSPATRRGWRRTHVFLGNISEYYAALPSGQVLRVQTHPLQHFAVGDAVAVEIDATQCSVFAAIAATQRPKLLTTVVTTRVRAKA